MCGRRLDTSRTVRRSRFSIYIHSHVRARETTMPCTIINKVSFAEIHFNMKVYHDLLHWPSLRAAITMVIREAHNTNSNTSQFNFIMNLNVMRVCVRACVCGYFLSRRVWRISRACTRTVVIFGDFPRFSSFSLAIPLQDRSIHLTYWHPHTMLFVEMCVWVWARVHRTKWMTNVILLSHSTFLANQKLIKLFPIIQAQ